MMKEELDFKVVADPDGRYEVLGRASKLLLGRLLYEGAVTQYPQEKIIFSHGARVIQRNFDLPEYVKDSP